MSVGVVLELLLWIAFVGWTTNLVIQANRQDRIHLGKALASLPRWFLPMLAVELFGWGVLLVCLAAALALGSVSIVFVLVVIGVWSLIWNLLTAALLLVVTVDQRPFFTRFREGLRLSWRKMGR